MFSFQHLIWLAVCAVAIFLALRELLSRKPSLEQVLSVSCVLAAASELVKILTYLQMVPTADGSAMHMFIEWRHMPFHLCSIQIFLIFYARFSESKRRRETILAFMYPTCVFGAFLALVLPSIFTNGIEPAQAFTHPVAYQFFVYHSMLVVLGVYIARCGEVDISFSRHLRSSLAIFLALGMLSVYANSAFAYVTYTGTQLLSVENTPNFFFTFRTPIGLLLTEKWQWYVYIAIISALAALVFTLFYLPFRDKKPVRG